MNTKYKLMLFLLVAALGMVGLLVAFLATGDAAVIHPKGLIAEKQRDLLIVATLLMLIVVVPVFLLLFFIVWRFRATNTKARYRPDWDGNRLLELTWWGVPFAIVMVLAVLTWQSSHELDPYRPLDHPAKPVRVQVVALQWKWLFIYPEHNIASVNLVQFPENTPVNFELTADAPMNSFWIPSLAGQVYAMNGMNTKLHLIANEPGDYEGVSSNISGDGFASMRFVARASSQQQFDDWVRQAQTTESVLDKATYTVLAQPSKADKERQFSTVEDGLYDTIIMKYMGGHGEGSDQGIGPIDRTHKADHEH